MPPDALQATAASPPRFGFTVTKKLGNAVARNRIRRRLKAAIASVATQHAETGYDYVVVARSAAFDRAYDDVIADLVKAFAILHAPRRSSRPQRTKNRTEKRQP